MPVKGPLGRIGGFALIPLIGTVTPLLVIPAITSTQGAAGWASIAIGQSVGGGASVLVELGWALTGPQLIAKSTSVERAYLYRLAHLSKAAVFLSVGPLAAVLAYVLAPTEPLSAALTALAGAALGMSPIWFFIGTAEPLKILYSDTLQRIVLTAVSAVLLLNGLPLVVYAVLSLVSALMAPLLGLIWARSRGNRVEPVTVGAMGRSLRTQSLALAGRSFSAIYIALPVVIVSIVSPSSVAVFAAAERLQRMGLGVLQSIPNSMQGWIGSADSTVESKSRLKKALQINVALGLFSGIAFGLLAPLASRIIFTGEATVPFELSFICMLVILLTCVSRATGGLALVAFRGVHVIAYSAAAGGAVGLTLIALLGHLYGSAGAMAGEVAAELTVLLVQLVFLRRYWKR